MERLAKLEQKRLEKEAKDRERAEQQAREQARRGIEKERARLAKRYPLPDEVCVCCRSSMDRANRLAKWKYVSLVAG